MKNLTAVDYISIFLEEDFGCLAPIIETWLGKRMEEFDDIWEPVADEEQAEFQGILELLVYPFLACYKALLDTDLPEIHAGEYCQQIWKKLPVRCG